MNFTEYTDYKNDISKISLLYLLTVFVTYFLPNEINNILMLFLIFFLGKSKKNYVWIVYIMLITGTIGGLFSKYDINHTAPSLNLIPGLSEIEFGHLMILILFVKAILSKKRFKYYLNKSLFPIIIYLLPLFLLTIYYGVDDVRSWLRIARLMLPLTLFYSLPRLINFIEIKKIIYLFIPVLLVIFFITILEYITGIKLVALLGASGYDMGAMQALNSIIDVEEQSKRLLYGAFINYFEFIGLTFLFLKNEITFKKWVLLIFIIIFLIVLSGSRGWIVTFLLMTIIIISRVSYGKKFKIIIISLILGATIIVFVPKLLYQIRYNFDRFSSTIGYVRGTSDDLLKDNRIENRIPNLIRNIGDQWVLGYGFSNKFMDNRDGHIAFLNMIFNIGILGFSIFMLSIFSIIIIIFKRSGTRRSNQLFSLGVGLVGLLLINATSRTIFSYLLEQDIGLFLALYLVFIDYALKYSRSNNI